MVRRVKVQRLVKCAALVVGLFVVYNLFTARNDQNRDHHLPRDVDIELTPTRNFGVIGWSKVKDPDSYGRRQFGHIRGQQKLSENQKLNVKSKDNLVKSPQGEGVGENVGRNSMKDAGGNGDRKVYNKTGVFPPNIQDKNPSAERVSDESYRKFHPDGIDWELEEEMKKRRTAFFEALKQKEQSFNASDFQDMHEREESLAFVTAGSHASFEATIAFIYSVQYFYPSSQIAVYDVGLTEKEVQFMNSLCKTEIVSLWTQLWPANLYEIRERVWRPLVLQFAMAKFGHYVYVEPGRFINRQAIRDYVLTSQRHGVIFAGTQYKHSTYVVTNPHMYTFLLTDERKLQATSHFSPSLAVIHNTRRVRHEFMRYLVTCALEEYCIAPPGSKVTCDPHTGNNRRYARCHRYDESAINLILNRWHKYQAREFLMRDVITKRFDGRDRVGDVKICGVEKDEV